jgi:cell wall-associated NlpC family hydrolase
MASKRHNTLTCFIANLCVWVLMVACGHAWSAEVPEQAPSTTMEKLHDFTDRAAELAIQAMGLVGINYKRGGNTPEDGLDCSGFVRHVFKEAWGANLPRTAAEISRVGKPVDSKDLQPGDLVFYNTLKRGFSHVGIYLGDSKFIHAPSTGGQVRIESMTVNYWKKRFNGARRMDDPGKAENSDS